MKKINKVSAVILSIALILGIAGPTTTFAATTPSLGVAANYGVLSSTYTNTTAGTTITGDVGFTTGPAVAPAGARTYYGSGAPYSTAGIDQGAALTLLNSQPCTFTFAPGAIDLATDITHSSSTGVYLPGVYCTQGAASIGAGGITLNGAGTYIFRITGALTTVDNSVVTLAGASACDVFWTPTAATTLGANSTFVGTDIDASGITVGSTVAWTGRALAFGGTVTTDTDTITTSCAAAPATITVVKTVVNDNGRTNTVADFPLFVNGAPVVSGVANTFTAPATYAVTETVDSNYVKTFSGDCSSSGSVDLNPGGAEVCVVTNNDIAPTGGSFFTPSAVVVPPLIDVLKVPNPLALPAGPGPVTYTYTLSNIGTVPVSDITMVDDTCSPITLISGDTNNDSKLDIVETWTYTCSTNLSETHTNIVTATGWANGLSATDIANATVIVGIPLVPPLIHVTKVPNPLILPAGGGMVTYTEKITNPGTVALSNVRLTDDKCSPVGYVSGDTNNDSKLDIVETWTYTCSTNLTKTTTNIATASGEANGLVAKDFAIATVVVTAPKLPNTGVVPSGKNTPWNIVVFSGVLVLLSSSLAVILRKNKV